MMSPYNRGQMSTQRQIQFVVCIESRQCQTDASKLNSMLGTISDMIILMRIQLTLKFVFIASNAICLLLINYLIETF